jgi:hypothetical protein
VQKNGFMIRFQRHASKGNKNGHSQDQAKHDPADRFEAHIHHFIPLTVIWFANTGKNRDSRHEKKTSPGRLDQFIPSRMGFIAATPEYSGSRLAATSGVLIIPCEAGEIAAADDCRNLLPGRLMPSIAINRQGSEGKHRQRCNHR